MLSSSKTEHPIRSASKTPTLKVEGSCAVVSATSVVTEKESSKSWAASWRARHKTDERRVVLKCRKEQDLQLMEALNQT